MPEQPPIAMAPTDSQTQQHGMASQCLLGNLARNEEGATQKQTSRLRNEDDAKRNNIAQSDNILRTIARQYLNVSH